MNPDKVIRYVVEQTSAVAGILTCFLAIATVHADVYKWVDDQGKVHYSDAPPRGAASQKIEIPMSAPPQGENAQERLKAFLQEQKKQEEA